MKIKESLIGKMAKAHHPITCANPSKTFVIVDVKVEWREWEQDWIVSVRGEETCWFGRNYWELVK